MSDLGIPFPDLWLWFPHQKSLIMKHSQPFTKTNKNLCSIKAILFETMVLKWLALKSHPRYSSIWSCSQKFRQTMLKHVQNWGRWNRSNLAYGNWTSSIVKKKKKRPIKQPSWFLPKLSQLYRYVRWDLAKTARLSRRLFRRSELNCTVSTSGSGWILQAKYIRKLGRTLICFFVFFVGCCFALFHELLQKSF